MDDPPLDVLKREITLENIPLYDGKWYYYYMAHSSIQKASIFMVYSSQTQSFIKQYATGINSQITQDFVFTVGGQTDYLSFSGTIYNIQQKIEEGAFIDDERNLQTKWMLKPPEQLLIYNQLFLNIDNQPYSEQYSMISLLKTDPLIYSISGFIKINAQNLSTEDKMIFYLKEVDQSKFTLIFFRQTWHSVNQPDYLLIQFQKKEKNNLNDPSNQFLAQGDLRIDISNYINKWIQFYIGYNSWNQKLSIQFLYGSNTIITQIFTNVNQLIGYNLEFKVGYNQSNRVAANFDAKDWVIQIGEGAYSEDSKQNFFKYNLNFQLIGQQHPFYSNQNNFTIKFWFRQIIFYLLTLNINLLIHKTIRFLKHIPVLNPVTQTYPYNIAVVIDDQNNTQISKDYKQICYNYQLNIFYSQQGLSATQTEFLFQSYDQNKSITFPKNQDPQIYNESEWIFVFLSFSLNQKKSILLIKYLSGDNIIYEMLIHSTLPVINQSTLHTGKVSNLSLNGFNGQIYALKTFSTFEDNIQNIIEYYAKSEQPKQISQSKFQYNILFYQQSKYDESSLISSKLQILQYITLNSDSFILTGWACVQPNVIPNPQEFIIRVTPFEDPSISTLYSKQLLVVYETINSQYYLRMITYNRDQGISVDIPLTLSQMQSWVYFFYSYSFTKKQIHVQSQDEKVSFSFKKIITDVIQYRMPVSYLFVLKDYNQEYNNNLQLKLLQIERISIGFFKFIIGEQVSDDLSAVQTYGFDESCKTANTFLHSQCTSCESHLILQNQYCIPCPSGYFIDSNGLCLQCDNNCLTCGGKATNCKTCKLSEMIIDFTLKCVCPDGKYLTNQNGTIQCQQCNQNCLTCLNNSLECTSCRSIYHQILDISNKICICEEGYFMNSSSQCQKCDDTCKTCKNFSSECNSCYDEQQNRKLIGNLCTCQEGTGLININDLICKKCNPQFVLNSSNLQCENCSKICNGCLITKDRCTSCYPDQFRELQGNKCECIDGYIDVGNDICQKCSMNTFKFSKTACKQCHISCQTCNGSLSNKCISCDFHSHRIFQDGYCKCIPGYIENVSIQQCVQCHQNCKECLGSQNECSVCHSGYSLNKVTNKCECIVSSLSYSNNLNKCTNSRLLINMKPYKIVDLINIQIDFAFSEDLLNNQNELLKSITLIEIEGTPKINYGYNIQWINMNTLRVEVSFYTSVMNKQIKIQFKDMNLFLSVNQNTLGQSDNMFYQQIKSILYIDPKSKEYQQTKAIYEMQQQFTSDGSFIAQLLNTLGNVSIVAFLVNSVQLSIIILSINTVLPINFYCILKIFGSTIIPNISDWDQENEESSYDELGFSIKKQEYQSSVDYSLRKINLTSSFLINTSLLIIKILIGSIFIFFLIKFLVHRMVKFKNAEQKIRLLSISFMIEDFIINFIESNFFILTVSLFVQFYYYENKDGLEKNSMVVSVLLLILLVGIFTSCYFKIRKRIHLKIEINFTQILIGSKEINLKQYYSNNENSNSLLDQYIISMNELSCLTRDIQLDNDGNLFYHLINFIKKLSCSMILVFAHTNPYVQISLIIVLHLIFLVLVLIKKPYNSKFKLFSQCISDLVLIVLLIMILVTHIQMKQLINEDLTQQQQQDLVQIILRIGFGQGILFVIMIIIYLIVYTTELIESVSKILNKYLKKNEIK